ncbi:carboxypeptidase-like regulatory domain-containing protein [Aquimarina brevivitae]|uniref:Carboxypeptidase-like protein n=1 Tax=Aquimarina brevivitae TaxID=323412 RepID=A0A4Q7P076_9FLAO|nr:carboxypeptidase-like regulatory domain-containing protein [Aquimarina brevivitae]RZS93181.1 carboxypeptidase-like protein [Aquimarina brevivitae]
MKTQFNLSIQKPCTQNFNHFAPTPKGGFCDSCKKEVVDFSTMKSEEINTYFKNHSAQNTCGRFKTDQFTTYTYPTLTKKRTNFINSLVLGCIAFFSFAKAQAQENSTKEVVADKDQASVSDTLSLQETTIKGVVTDGEIPLPGVNVVLQGSTIGIQTDFDGKFTFPKLLKKGDVLVFNYLGFKTKKVPVLDTSSAKEVTLAVDLKEETIMLMGAVAVKKVYQSKSK